MFSRYKLLLSEVSSVFWFYNVIFLAAWKYMIIMHGFYVLICILTYSLVDAIIAKWLVLKLNVQ